MEILDYVHSISHAAKLSSLTRYGMPSRAYLLKGAFKRQSLQCSVLKQDHFMLLPHTRDIFHAEPRQIDNF